MFAEGSELKVITNRGIRGDFERKISYLEVANLLKIKTNKDTVLRFKQEVELENVKSSIQVVWNPALYSYGEISGPTFLFPGDQLELAIRPFSVKEPLPELDYFARLFVLMRPLK